MRIATPTLTAAFTLLALGHPALTAQMVSSQQVGSHEFKQTLSPLGPTAPFPSLTDNRHSVTNFNEEVFRGFVITPDDADIYGLNVMMSTIVHFLGATQTPVDVWPTLNQPSAIAFYQSDLLVVGGATHALALHSSLDGQIQELLPFGHGAEPADIVVDHETDRAYVSLQGVDAVVEIDLLTFTETRRFELDVKRPGFLFLDGGDPLVASDSVVYVTPQVSGNNSMVFDVPLLGAFILGGDQTQFFPDGGLPDHDLLRIDPNAAAGAEVMPVLRTVGSILNGHGLNPVTGEYWIAAIDQINDDLALQSEPLINGRFALNHLTIGDPSASGVPNEPTTFVDLDDTDNVTPGGQYDPALSLSYPYGLTITSGGFGLITASTSDRVTLTDTAGQPLVNLECPPGSTPRQALLDPATETVLLVYCQNTNTIEIFGLFPLTINPVLTLDLGHDPLFEPWKKGRETWYDADKSADGRSSCNVCHPGGGADGIAWQISDSPNDKKDVMVTQTLMGIEDTFPYHWRGERDLSDFNVAFPGLLGADGALDETPGGELDEFSSFIFSLQQPANPTESPDRIIDNARTPNPHPNGKPGNAVRGLIDYSFFPSDAGTSCAGCHFFPTGGSGDIITEIASSISSQGSMDVTHLDNQLVLKRQEIVTVNTVVGEIQRPALGFGTLHSGIINSLFDFVDLFGALSDKQVSNITSFIDQFDHGIAPRVHDAILLNSASDVNAIEQQIQDGLLAQAEQGWIDVIAFGTYPVGGSPTPLSWRYDTGTGLFLCEDPVIASVPLEVLADVTDLGLASNVFMGVPPGNGVRLGVDRDNDGLTNVVELALGTNPIEPDSDGDGWPDGHELLNSGNPLDDQVISDDTTPPALIGDFETSFINATQAKFFFQTNEPVKVDFTYSTVGGDLHTHSILHFDRVHTAVLQNLEPSTSGIKTNTFQATATLTDLGGNATVWNLPNFDAESMFHGGAPFLTVVGDISFISEVRNGSTLDAVAQVRVDFKEQGPPALQAPNMVVVGQVLIEDTVNGGWIISPNVTTNLPTSFDLDGAPYDALPGTFLVAKPTLADGIAMLDFSQPNLLPGQQVRLNIIAIMQVEDPRAYDPAAPAFSAPTAPIQYQGVKTKPENRAVTTTF